MLAQTDPATLVRMWVAFAIDVEARVSAIGHVLEVASDIDPDVAELARDIERQRLTGARAFIDHLARIGGLRNGITRAQAAEWCWAHMSPNFCRPLVMQQGWSTATLEQWLTRSISAVLLPLTRQTP